MCRITCSLFQSQLRLRCSQCSHATLVCKTDFKTWILHSNSDRVKPCPKNRYLPTHRCHFRIRLQLIFIRRMVKCPRWRTRRATRECSARFRRLCRRRRRHRCIPQLCPHSTRRICRNLCLLLPLPSLPRRCIRISRMSSLLSRALSRRRSHCCRHCRRRRPRFSLR